MSRRTPAVLATVAVAAAAVLIPTLPASAGGGGHGPGHGGSPGDAVLERYAADTWHSLDAMTDAATGLPADNIEGDLTAPSGETSPTNIGGYLWSAVAARDLGIISRHDAHQRMATTLTTLASLERHDASGMFYNWYSPTTGEKLTTWPETGDVVYPFLSTVDNGWLAAALRVVGSADPSLKKQAQALYSSMDFGWFHDPAGGTQKPGIDPSLGLNRGGFWVEQPGDTCTVPGNYHDAAATPVLYTCHWYDTTVSESRIATYLGIANGQIPAKDYYGTYRTLPDQGCDFGWQEQKPTGTTRTYSGVSVYEGTYAYRGMQLVPAWGGSMFEALMPDLFVPESTWGPASWGVNHPATVRAQIEHGIDEAGYGYWGFSPASDPAGGYREYGVDLIGMQDNGYTSDEERTDPDVGYAGCRDATNPSPAYGDGVVTPHASFLALPYDRQAALDNLAGIESTLGAYGPGGFFDAVATKSGAKAERYLSLDQSMIMGAILNAVDHDKLKTYFVDRTLEQRLKPVIAAEVFGSHL
jgi:hypothetical protein